MLVEFFGQGPPTSMTPFTWSALPLGEMETPDSVRVTSLPWQLDRSHDVDAVCWVGGMP